MRPGIVTLLTDFGEGPYAAAMKGVILSAAPGAQVMDITHEVRPQDLMEGAFVLAAAAFEFPAGTVHAAVVDPGVGTARRVVIVEAGAQIFVAPDNGLLTLVLKKAEGGHCGEAPARTNGHGSSAEPFDVLKAMSVVEWLAACPPCPYNATYLRAWQVTNENYFRHPVSATFHGRDIIAPVAGAIAAGERLEAFGPEIPIESLAGLIIPEPDQTPGGVLGEVIFVDRFGNLVTNIEAAVIEPLGPADELDFTCGGVTIRGLKRTYGDGAQGEILAIVGSFGHLEVAISGGNAQKSMSLGLGAGIMVRRR